MTLTELARALRQLRLSGIADVLPTRLQHPQDEHMAPLDLVAMLVSDALLRRQDRLFERRHKQAGFRDPDKGLDGFGLADPPAHRLCRAPRLADDRSDRRSLRRVVISVLEGIRTARSRSRGRIGVLQTLAPSSPGRGLR